MSDDEETVTIIKDFCELTLNENFRDKMKHNSKINTEMLNLANEIFRAVGVTEYTAVDGGYTGDEILEKHKFSKARAWNCKKAKPGHTKEITSDEIMSSADRYLARRLNFEKKREKKLIEEGHQPRKLITDESTGMQVYASHAQKILAESDSDAEPEYNSSDYESDEGDDDEFMEKLIRKQ